MTKNENQPDDVDMSYRPKNVNEAIDELFRLCREATDADEERLATISDYLNDYRGRAREDLTAQVDELLERAASVSENQPK